MQFQLFKMEPLPALQQTHPGSKRPLSGESIPARVCAAQLTNLCRMGELEPWIDEDFVLNLWFQMGEQVIVKMIRDKFSG